MNLTMNISPEKEAAYQALAQAQGLSVEQWLTQLADQAAPVADLSPPPEQEPQRDSKRPIWEVIAERARALAPEVVERLPEDGASQHDHYIYGLPKREQ